MLFAVDPREDIIIHFKILLPVCSLSNGLLLIQKATVVVLLVVAVVEIVMVLGTKYCA
jgi:hypothetical protein